MIRELRFAIRMLLKQPGFSLIAALTLALGIGATSAVFSLIQGVLLTPPPYQKPEQLVLIPTARTDGQTMDSPRGWAAQQWMDWQKNAKSFQGVAAYDWTFNFLIRNDGSQSMQGMYVTKDYLRVMGLKPMAGRGFEDSDFGQGPERSILLGYEFWQRAFGGDRQIIGKTVRISRWDVPPTVIGVMAPGVRFLPSPGAAKEPNYNVNATVDFWAPVEPDPKALKAPRWNVVGRLRDGATPQQGQQELAVLTAREAQADKAFEGFAPRLEPVTDEMNRDGRRILLPLLGRCGAGTLDRLRKCGSAAAVARTAKTTGIRGADGNGHGSRSPSKASLDGELAAGSAWRDIWRRVGLWRRKTVQGNCRTCRSAAGRSESRLGSFGLGTWCGSARRVYCRNNSGDASVPVGSDGGVERRWTKRNGRNGREAVAAGSHDAADGADVGAADGCGVADSYDGENRRGAVGI
jgi:hypothetical protein